MALAVDALVAAVALACDVEQLLATQPSELHALTAELSAVGVEGERKRAESSRQLRAEVRVVCQREHELLDEPAARCADLPTGRHSPLPHALDRLLVRVGYLPQSPG